MGPFFRERGGLEDPPDKVRQEREQQQHEYSANPDEEVPRHSGVVDLFLVHARS